MKDTEVFVPTELNSRVGQWIQQLFGDSIEVPVVAGSVAYRSKNGNVAIVGESEILGFKSIYFPKKGYWESDRDCAEAARSFLGCTVIFDGGNPLPTALSMISDEYSGELELCDDGVLKRRN